MKLSALAEGVNKLRGQSVLLYGPPKTGKTKLAGDLAKHGFEIDWFDLENGVSTLLATLPEEFWPQVNVIQIPDSRSNPIAINTMMKVLSGSPCLICEEHGKVSCPECMKGAKPSNLVELRKNGPNKIVVIDSLSQLSDSAYAGIRGAIENKMEWSDFDTWNQQLAMMLSQLQVAPYHSVCISHENMVEMQDKSMRIVAVGGTRNFSSRIAKFFGHVVYTEVAFSKFKVGSSPTYKVNVTAGSRSNIELDLEKGIGLEVFFQPQRYQEIKQEQANIKQPAKLGAAPTQSAAVANPPKLVINPASLTTK